MSLHPAQLTTAVVHILSDSHTYSNAAKVLILGTIAQESHCGTYLYQLGGGPARGIGQMEPATEQDIWKHHITRHNKQGTVASITGVAGPDVSALTFNIAYQILMVRYHYLRVTEPLPHHSDIAALGRYWDKHYNCNPHHGTPEEFVRNYERFILDA